MRILVCGSRHGGDAAAIARWLDEWRALMLTREGRRISLLIHGAASGVDTLAGEWAKARGIAVETYPADWNNQGRAAGPIRNARMLRVGKPDVAIAFPGGIGTANMVALAESAGVPVVQAKP